MISQEGDYYICQGDTLEEQSNPPPQQSADTVLEAKGDIKERLALIKQRISALKEEKQQQSKQKDHSSWVQQYNEPIVETGNFELTLTIPTAILQLQRRVEQLEGKVTDYEIHRQKTQKKGTVIDRIKSLQKKLTDMLRAKSIETITNSIIQYSTNLEQKQEHMKQLTIYAVYTKTQGLTEELGTLQGYLQQLSQVQHKVSSTLPTGTMLQQHNQILEKADKLQKRVTTLFANMTQQYKQLLAQIDSIEI